MPFSLATLLSFQSTFHTVWVWEVLVISIMLSVADCVTNWHNLTKNKKKGGALIWQLKQQT